MTDAKKIPKAQVTKRKLIDAAAEEFNSVGYFNTDTNKIAVRAGYAPATYYKHFSNKLEAFLEAYKSWVEDEWRKLEAKGNDPETLIRVVLSHHKKFLQFRTDLRALAATEPAVKKYQTKLRRDQVKRLGALNPALAPVGTDWSTQVFLLLTMERVADAIADGSAKASHATEDALIAHLIQLINDLTN